MYWKGFISLTLPNHSSTLGKVKTRAREAGSESETASVRAAVAMMTHHDHSNLGRKGFIWLKGHNTVLSPKEIKSGTQSVAI